MNVTCIKCNTTYDLQRAGLVLRAAKCGAASLEDFLKTYICKQCLIDIRYPNHKTKKDKLKAKAISKNKNKNKTKQKTVIKPTVEQVPFQTQSNTLSNNDTIPTQTNVSNSNLNTELDMSSDITQNVEPVFDNTQINIDTILSTTADSDDEKEISFTEIADQMVSENESDTNNIDDIFTKEEQEQLDELINEQDDEEEISPNSL